MSSGLVHTNIGSQLTQAEYHADGSHTLSGGTSFPGSPNEQDLFYRTDEHKWYIRTDSDWLDLTSQGNDLSSIGESLLPSDPDTYSIGSASAEWLNFYIGNAGKLYFGLSQDIELYRSAANVLSLGSDDSLYIPREIILNAAPGTNDTGSGFISSDTVGENVSVADVLYMKGDGKYWKADADAETTMPGEVLATEAISADASGNLLHRGYFRHDTWNWTVGNGAANLLYVHTTAGEMVQTANRPTGSGDQLQILGYVVTADIIYFNPSLVLGQVV